MTMISWEKLTKDMADATRKAYNSNDSITLADLPDMISALNTEKPSKIYFSSTAPTVNDGNDNDIWVVIE